MSADAAVTVSPVATSPEPPLWLGSREMPSRYFLAPLAGYTHLALRLTLRELGGLGLATTDLVLATHLLSRNRHSLELIETAAEETPGMGSPRIVTPLDSVWVRIFST